MIDFKKIIDCAASRFWILNLIAHELAHQWFGNIVTLDWWVTIKDINGFYVILVRINFCQLPQPTSYRRTSAL